MRRASVAGVLALVAATGCADEPAALEVGPVAYTEGELLGLLDEQRVLLGDITAVGLAIAAGEAERLGRPLVERAALEASVRLLRAAHALDSAGVGEEVLRARYRTDPALELTVRHLLVLSDRFESDEERRRARAKAERALERIRAGEPFPDVAAEVSEEPGAEGREGLLSPGREGAWVPEFWTAATSLEPGGISGVVETQYGFHVLRLEARDTVPFDEVRGSVVLEVADLMGVPADPADPAAFPYLRPSLRLAERIPDPEGPGVDSTAVAARWDGGAMTVGEVGRFLLTLPPDEWRATRDDPEARRAAAREAAALHAATAAARARGLEVPLGVVADAERSWTDLLLRWEAVFGFGEGQPPDAVRSAALEALGATGQGPDLARREIRRHAPLFRTRTPVSLRDGGAPGG